MTIATEVAELLEPYRHSERLLERIVFLAERVEREAFIAGNRHGAEQTIAIYEEVCGGK